MTKRQAESLVRKLERHKEKIAAERDAIRMLLAEYEDILDSVERADEYLEAAVAALSELL